MKNQRLYNYFLTGLLTFAVCFVLPADAEAQIWKNLGKKIEKKVEDQASRRLEKKIDKTIDKGFDAAEDGLDDAAKSGTAQSKKAIAKQYDFNLGITYEISQDNKKNDQVGGMSMWFSNEPYVGMSSDAQTDAFMVMDDGQIITFMESNKTYMVMGTGFLGQIVGGAEEAADDSTPADFKMEKIGSEQILGYNCDIYRVTSDDTQSRIWVAPSLGKAASGLMQGFGSFLPKNQINMADLDRMNMGMALKVVTTNDKNETITMQATKVHKQGKKINTSNYKSMGF